MFLLRATHGLCQQDLGRLSLSLSLLLLLASSTAKSSIWFLLLSAAYNSSIAITANLCKWSILNGSTEKNVVGAVNYTVIKAIPSQKPGCKRLRAAQDHRRILRVAYNSLSCSTSVAAIIHSKWPHST